MPAFASWTLDGRSCAQANWVRAQKVISDRESQLNASTAARLWTGIAHKYDESMDDRIALLASPTTSSITDYRTSYARTAAIRSALVQQTLQQKPSCVMAYTLKHNICMYSGFVLARSWLVLCHIL